MKPSNATIRLRNDLVRAPHQIEVVRALQTEIEDADSEPAAVSPISNSTSLLGKAWRFGSSSVRRCALHRRAWCEGR
jgi:hypothetical protein